MAKKKSSKRWMQRHVTDPFVKLAQQKGYRARAAFKLLELVENENLLRPGDVVVDLGAAPGSWSQVARERLTRNGNVQGRIIALDILPMDPIPDVVFIQGDFREDAVLHQLEDVLAGDQVDLVISDMAPNLSGIRPADAARIAHMAELALEFALDHLTPDGTLLLKTFHGSGYSQFVETLKTHFKRVLARKPQASRDESAETFLLAQGRKPT